MKIFNIFILLFLVSFSINAQVTTTDLLGEWKMVTKTPIGDSKQNFTILFENEKLIGITKNGKVEIHIDGNQLSWKNSVGTPLGKINIHVEGIYKNSIITGFSSPVSGKMKGRKLYWTMKKS